MLGQTSRFLERGIDQGRIVAVEAQIGHPGSTGGLPLELSSQSIVYSFLVPCDIISDIDFDQFSWFDRMKTQQDPEKTRCHLVEKELQPGEAKLRHRFVKNECHHSHRPRAQAFLGHLTINDRGDGVMAGETGAEKNTDFIKSLDRKL